jgi:peptide/nickel transport system substrate-binding protein
MSWCKGCRALAAAVAVIVAVGWGAVSGPAHASIPSRSPAGGSLTVLEGSTIFGSWPGLDPATDTSDAANQDYLNSIYGELFEQSRTGAPIPDLATGYKISGAGTTVSISLRHGVTFQDGTPFNAQAVAFNIHRYLEPQYACICLPNFPVSSISTPDAYTVVLQLSRPFAPIITAFFGEAPNWIVSPTALQRMGETAFALTPVGAGPFKVVTDRPNSLLKLARFSGYWQKGHPFLQTLTFQSIGTDQSAYDAMLAGQAGAYEDFSTYSLISQVKKHFTVAPVLPSTSGPYVVQLNTTAPPFNNIVAREALYYATNPATINHAIYQNLATPTQSLTGPGDLFYEPKVPGYRTYDLHKAKALVRQLGGLRVTLGGAASGTTGGETMTALASQWAQAGIKTTLVSETLPQLIQDFRSGKWQAEMQLAGGYDPALGLGLSFRYLSTAPFSGIHDPKLDQMITEGAATLDQAARAKTYRQIFKYISDQAYSPVLFFTPLYNLAARSVSGPGLSASGPQILWEDVSVR